MDYMKTLMARRVVLITFLITLAIRYSNSYGFDAGTACSEKTARRGRAVILKSIPCDLSTQAYCDLPGSLYPWNAVRRFVNENQGMMKRMYGDVRHISVLRNEINNNDITLDDIEEATARYSRAGWKRNKYQQSSKSNKNVELKSAPEYRRASPTNRSNERSTNARSTTSTTTTPTSPTTSTINTTIDSLPVDEQSDEPLPLAISSKDAKKIKPILEKREKMTTITMDKLEAAESKSDDLATYEEIIEAAIEEIFISPNSTIDGKSTNSTESTKQSESFTEAYGNSTTPSNQDILIARVNKSETAATISTTLRLHGLIKANKSTTTEPNVIVVDENTNVYTTESNPIANMTNISQASFAALTSTGSSGSDELNGGKDDIDATGTQIDQNRVPGDVDDENDDDDDVLTGEIRPGDGTNDSTEDKKPLDGISVGQLYQDVAEKEDPIIVDSHGVNACPVKEEVVAPFWANNTRGEVLALLNLYPFEQYVHWEKCTQEHKQMYCRDGCRCEQQYRLHRLLAYDPHNECRGIFSDWFRFPSCCICKCYNIPIEYRVTSRSPRSLDKLNSDQHEPEVAISSHQFDDNEEDDSHYSNSFHSADDDAYQ